MHVNHVAINNARFPVINEYPFCLELFQKTDGINFVSPVTFFVGENGSGKSTLLEALARACGIYIWQGDTRARASFNPYETSLYQFLAVSWKDGRVPGSFFAADIFKNFSRILDEWASMDPGVLEYFGGKSLMTQSHGQSLMSFFSSRFTIPGIYLLDEPEAALSPKTQFALLDVLTRAVKIGQAQFVIASHSPILLSCPGADILNFDAVPVSSMKYRDTAHFRVYRDFLNDQEAGASVSANE
ncbi:MAG: AAA family ATPase [Spirochaetaceae bacterium]|nr:MAG: AAA family ATPase [Spirochaetaceae bacterium]